MASPRLGANPTEEPYRVLGIDPTAGANEFVSKEEIENHAKKLLQQNKDNKEYYRNIQYALREIRDSHPDQSRSGVWRVPMEINLESSTVEIQSNFTVQVVDFLGNPIPNATLTLESGQRIGRTEADGTDNISIPTELGSITIVANKGADGNKEYVDARASINVKKSRTSLQFDQVPSSCVAGDQIKVRVVDDQGNPKPGTNVVPETGSPSKTDKDGWATPQIDDSGETKLTARKSETNFERYEEAVTKLSVKKREVSLRISKYPRRTKVGEQELFRVVDENDEPVENVLLSIATGSESTTQSGSVSLTIPPQAAGKTQVTASKQNTPGIKYSGDTVTINVKERTVDLSFRRSPNKVTVGKKKRLRIVDENGDPIPDVTVRTKSSKDRTGNRGHATLSFSPSAVGQTTITATKQGPQGINYLDATTTVEVVKQRSQLRLSVENESPKVEQDVTFRVHDGDGSVKGATIKHRSQRDTTNQSGSASLTFDTAGSKKVIVYKDETPSTVYESNTVGVEVDRLTKRLRIMPPDGKIEAGDTVTFSVIGNDDGRGVEDVTLNGEDSNTQTTTRNGKADITFTTPGEKRLKVSKPVTKTHRYITDTITVQVRVPPKSVNIVEVPDDAQVGDDARIKLIDHTGSPLPNAIIKAVSRKENIIKKTDKNGIATLTFNNSGYYQISASKEGFDVYDETQLRVNG
ncbi:hypothetical protein ACLI4Q_06060 [Natrialbaceae archaeon A-CW1-1]